MTPAPREALPTSREPAPVPLREANQALAILLIFLAISFLDRQILSLLVDDIRHGIRISDVQIGLLQGFAFSLVYALAGLPIGWAIDRYSRRLVIFIGISVWSLGTLACGLSDTFPHLFLARMLVGAGEAALAPAAFSLMADLFARDRLTSAIGTYYVGANLGAGIAFLAGGALIGALKISGPIALPVLAGMSVWQTVFVLVSLPGIVFSFFVFLIREPGRSHAERTAVERASIADFITFLRRRRAVLLCHFGGFSILGLAIYSVAAWSAAYFTRNFALPPGTVGTALFLAFGIGASVGNVTAGRVVDARVRSGHADAYFAVHVVTVLAGAPLVILAFTVPSFWAATALLSVGVGLLTCYGGSSSASLQLIAPPLLRGKLSVLYLFVLTGVGSGLGPLVTALLVERVFGASASVGYALMVIVAVCAPVGALLLHLGRPWLRSAIETGYPSAEERA